MDYAPDFETLYCLALTCTTLHGYVDFAWTRHRWKSLSIVPVDINTTADGMLRDQDVRGRAIGHSIFNAEYDRMTKIDFCSAHILSRVVQLEHYLEELAFLFEDHLRTYSLEYLEVEGKMSCEWLSKRNIYRGHWEISRFLDSFNIFKIGNEEASERRSFLQNAARWLLTYDPGDGLNTPQRIRKWVDVVALGCEMRHAMKVRPYANPMSVIIIPLSQISMCEVDFYKHMKRFCMAIALEYEEAVASNDGKKLPTLSKVQARALEYWSGRLKKGAHCRV